MNEEEQTAVLLSGAAADLEQVADLRREDMTSEEWTTLSELVARIKDLNETLSYESSLRDVSPRVEVEEEAAVQRKASQSPTPSMNAERDAKGTDSDEEDE